MDNNQNKKNNKNNPNNNRQGLGIVLITTLLVAFVLIGFFSAMGNTSQREISYDKFLKLVSEHKVKGVKLDSEKIYITLTDKAREEAREKAVEKAEKEGRLSPFEEAMERLRIQLPSVKKEGKEHAPDFYTGYVDDDTLVTKLDRAGVKFQSEIPDTIGQLFFEMFVTVILPLLLMVWLFTYMMKRMNKGGGMMGIGKSNAKMYMEKETGVTFRDVAGEDEAKESLQEVVDFLHNPGKYSGIGAKLPKGALLVGPPGTGKTLLAKAVAGEAGVPFFSISGSEFVEMFVGMGASKVRDLFKQANEKAPCIVFIDEIDTIGKKRDSHGMAGNDEREQTLNQLLTEMDGFDASKGVVILAATNRPDTLDPALLRPGRFDRRIPVELPDLKGREEILKVHARKIKLGDNVDFNAIARAASGASGAELANMVNEAALRAVRENRKFVVQSDLEESIEVVIAGYQKKNRVLSTKEKLIVAYHEIGHALVAALQTHSAPVTKITIIPRTSGALGYTMQVEEEERNLMTEEELKNKIATLTGGRCAEELVFGSVTTGASNDIEQATKLSRAMITRYGMSSRFGMVALETQSNPYLGGDSSLSCSPETAATIDDMVVDMVKQSYEKARKLLKDNQGKLHELAKYLYEKETITGDEFMRILSQKELSSDGETASGAEFAADGRQILEEEKASDKEVHISEE